MKRALIFAIIIIIGLIPSTGLAARVFPYQPPDPPPPPGDVPEIQTQIESTILQSLEAGETNFFSLARDQLTIQNIKLSPDKLWGTAWLALTDPQTGEVLPSEPALAITKWNGSDWETALPVDTNWTDWLLAAPEDLINTETKNTLFWMQREVTDAAETTTALGGYLLPWAAGQTVYLSRSVAHDADFSSGNAHYSFDFYVPQTMFDIHAAKPGAVWLYRDDVPNNDHNSVNYLVLEDTSTSSPRGSSSAWQTIPA